MLAAAWVAFAVLHVQLAHAYTADTLLTFFVMLTLNLAADVAQGGSQRRQLALGGAVGLALATKVSAAPLLLLIPVAFSRQRSAVSGQHGIRNTEYAIRLLPTLFMAALTFLLAQPYALIDAATFLDHTLRESQIAWGRLDVPYTRQYTGTLPYLYSAWQTALWGLGLPLGLAVWAGFGAALVRWLRHGRRADTLLLAWAGVYFGVTGLLYARHLRYMLPLVPVLCVLAVSFQPSAFGRRRFLVMGHWSLRLVHGSLVICSLAYSLLFVRIYAQPHPWIAASAWVYENVPAGSTLAVEAWDTALPLPLEVDGQSRRIEEYDVRVLHLYAEPDDAAKWLALADDLAAADYLVIASRRLYGSIPRLPDRYPLTSRYYERLFAGDLGFALAGEFSRGPAWLNPQLAPRPGAAPGWLQPDESFVVYDHPRTLVLANVERLPADELVRRLTAP